MMSHEIRTPLNGIVGLTHVLIDTNLTSEQKEYVEYILKSKNALLSIINDILDFSKIESGKVELEAGPFDLEGCIEETFDVHAISSREKKLDVSRSIAP